MMMMISVTFLVRLIPIGFFNNLSLPDFDFLKLDTLSPFSSISIGFFLTSISFPSIISLVKK